MSTKKTIAKSFTVSTIEDGVSVQAQYAPNANPTSGQIHTVWQEGDLYMRTRESDESAWSSWHKIVGESGDETNYTFALSAYKVSLDGTSSTAPLDITSDAWQDAPMATTSQKPYLWSKVQKKDGAGNNIGNPSYIRFTGEPGTSPYFADLDNEMDSIACANDGKPSSEQTVETNVKLYRGSTALSPTLAVNDDSPSGAAYTSGTAKGGITVTWNNTTGNIKFKFGTSNSRTKTETFCITLTVTDNGATITRYLYFTVNCIRAALDGNPAALYRLVPSVNEIVKKKDGTYVPTGNTYITCGVTKNVGGTQSTPSASEYTLKYSLNGGAETTYTATSVKANQVTSNLVFILYVNSVVVDRETIGLVTDGDKGNEGKGYKAVVTRNNFTESNWATYGASGHSETWSDTSSTRGNCKTGDWFIVVGTATDTKNYHIATYECSNDSGNLAGTCINHQITKDGQSYCFVFTSAFAKTDEDGIVTAGLSGYAYKYVGGVRSALTSTTIRYGYILTDSDTYVTTTTNSSGFFDAGTWFDGDDITDYGKNSPSIFAAIVIDGTVVHAEMITISVKGSTGARGKVGRFFYYAGEWNDFASTDSFLVNDAQAPYFYYNNNYWVFNPETNGTYTKQNMGTPSSSSANWKIMTSDFKYLITEALFTNFAKLASAIFSGDWMLSQYGQPTRVVTAGEKELVRLCVTVDGQYPVSDLATLLVNENLWNEYKGYGYTDAELESVADVCQWAVAAMPTNTDDERYTAIQTVSSTSYQLFGINQSNLFSVFSPNISLDFLQGKAYLNDCNIKGNLVGRVSNPLTRIKNGSVWGDYGVQTIDDYGYTRHYLFINRMPTWNVQIEYMSGAQAATRRLILPVITSETLGTEIKVVNVSGDTITVEGKPESSTYAAEGSYLLDGIQITGYSNDQRTIEMETQTMLKFVSVEIPTQYGEYGWIAIGEPQTIKSSN